MAETKIDTLVRTTRTYRVEIDRNDILGWLFQGREMPKDSDTQVYVQVPGESGWSSTPLDIEGSCPIIVTWKIESERYE